MEIEDMSPNDARQMLKAFCENGFDGSIEAAALALGRDDDEIQAMIEGEETVDADLIMKTRGIARSATLISEWNSLIRLQRRDEFVV
jgi:hypothetical protein